MLEKNLRERLVMALAACFVVILGQATWLFASQSPGYTIPVIDLAGEKNRQIIVDQEPGVYLGHPTTVLLEDGKTMLATYPRGHAHGRIFLKWSSDGGQSWSPRLETPKDWETSNEVPTLFRTTDAQGVKRLLMFSNHYPIVMTYSEDDGHTWSPRKPIGKFGGFAVASMVELGQGHYMAFTHDDGRYFEDPKTHKGQPEKKFTVYKFESADGGLTWSMPEVAVKHPVAHLCEPGVIRSPDGKQLAMLMRENSRQFNSFVSFSNDEGETWSEPVELPGAQSGDRHVGKYAPDGHLVITFRDTTRKSSTQGDFIAWIGHYDDIIEGREGHCRLHLLHNEGIKNDTGYAGLELLDDGTFVTTTYCAPKKGQKPMVISVRFNLDEPIIRKAL